jgi:hypothetical protein
VGPPIDPMECATSPSGPLWGTRRVRNPCFAGERGSSYPFVPYGYAPDGVRSLLRRQRPPTGLPGGPRRGSPVGVRSLVCFADEPGWHPLGDSQSAKQTRRGSSPLRTG